MLSREIRVTLVGGNLAFHAGLAAARPPLLYYETQWRTL